MNGKILRIEYHLGFFIFYNAHAHAWPKWTLFVISSDPSFIEVPFKPTTDYLSGEYRRFLILKRVFIHKPLDNNSCVPLNKHATWRSSFPLMEFLTFISQPNFLGNNFESEVKKYL